MKFIRELIDKSAKSSDKTEDLNADALRRDMAEGGFESPFAERSGKAVKANDDFDANVGSFDDEVAAPSSNRPERKLVGRSTRAKRAGRVSSRDLRAPVDRIAPVSRPRSAEPAFPETDISGLIDKLAKLTSEPAPFEKAARKSVPVPDEETLARPMSEPMRISSKPLMPAQGEAINPEDEALWAELEEDLVNVNEDEPEVWNLGIPGGGDRPRRSVDMVSELDDPIFEDEDEFVELDDIEPANAEADEQDKPETNPEALLGEIRSALSSVQHVRSDEELTRQKMARAQLQQMDNPRIFSETNNIMGEDKVTKRRNTIAMMKAAAQATRNDPKLAQMASHDPSNDPSEQSGYRQDLAVLGMAKSPNLPSSDVYEEDLEEAPPRSDGFERGDPEVMRAAILAKQGEKVRPAPSTAAPQRDEKSDRTNAENSADTLPRAGRVRTRMGGLEAEPGDSPFNGPSAKSAGKSNLVFPVGWIVIVAGQGMGHSFPICSGVSQIGRGEQMTIRLDFGDLAISRENHAAIAYDDDENTFLLGHGGKSNLVRLNDQPLLSTKQLKTGDEIRIGETTLRFVALCTENFEWSAQRAKEGGNAAIA